MKALSIRQPWAWLIVHAGKNIENRSWRSHYHGRFLVHAAKGMTRQEYDEAKAWAHACGAIEIPAFRDLKRRPRSQRVAMVHGAKGLCAARP
mgnify:CR=1 FL=1